MLTFCIFADHKSTKSTKVIIMFKIFDVIYWIKILLVEQ